MRFVYGAISPTFIRSSLVAYGGYHSACTQVSGTAAFNNDVTTELASITSFKESVQAMDDTSVFTSTFTTTTASYKWYYYIDADLNLSDEQ